MVSRQNLSGRGPYGGVLGRAYKGPSGPGKITPPGMETRGRAKLGPVDGEGVPAATSGAQSPAQKPRRGKGIFQQARSAIEQRREQIETDRAAKYPTTSPGVGETAYRPGFTDKDAARIRKDELRRMSKPERRAAKRQSVFDKMQAKYGGKKKRGGIGGMVRSAIEQQKAQQAALAEPQAQEFDPMLGVKESLGDAYVEPGTRPALGGNEPTAPAVAGGTTGAPRRRGSAASRSRRINR